MDRENAQLRRAVLTFGEPLIVFVPPINHRLDRTAWVSPYVAGAELNTAIGLARLDIPVSFAGAVGRDPFGERVIRAGRAEGVDMEAVQQSYAGPTAIFFKQGSGLSGDSEVFYYRSSSPMARGDWEVDLVVDGLGAGRWKWMHTTGITWMLGDKTRKQCQELMRRGREAGLTISFDINVRLKLATVEEWRMLVREVASILDWLLVGDEEARWLFQVDDARVVEELVREWGFSGEGVIVKRGAQGADSSVQGQFLHSPAWPVQRVVDTVGAGDGFNAGWIAGMMRGWTIQEAMRLGTLVGAYAVTSLGDSDGYPLWSEVQNILEGKKGIAR